jgi:hypothetical protein
MKATEAVLLDFLKTSPGMSPTSADEASATWRWR